MTGNHVRMSVGRRRDLRTFVSRCGRRASGQLLATARPGRLDLVRPRSNGGHPRPATWPPWPRPAADGARRRSPAATSLALEGLVSPLAGLEGLWDAPIAWDDPPALHRLERGLVEAEVKLSAYRRALHERIDACTAQLVDHYQRDPAQIVR